MLVAGLAFANPALAAPAPAAHAYDRTVDGDWTVAGASASDSYRGVAYVYHRTGRAWVLDATLAPAERGRFARFGSAVAIDGNTLVVGAPWDDGWKGAAYIYERVAGTWTLTSRVAPRSSVGDRFGSQVSIADGVVSLAADGGSVARFGRTTTGYNETGRIAAGAAGLTSGRTVEAAVLQAVAVRDAQAGVPRGASTLAIDPPAFVSATDSVYEDRTDIRWASVSGGPFLYKVYRRVSGQPVSANVLIRVASQDDSLYSDTSGVPGVVYTYCVTVLDMTSTEGAAACDDGSRIIFRPTEFTASDATYEGFVRLTWSDRSSVESGYRIRRNGSLLGVTIPDAIAFDDSTAAPGTTYSYSLVAVDAAGDTTAPRIDSGSSAFIAAPLLVSASDGQYPSKVVVTWVDNTALEVNYRVYRDGALRVTLPPNTRTFEDVLAAPGTTYEYCVAAVDGSARESARGCDTGGIGVLPAPVHVIASDSTFDDKVHVAWQDTSTTNDGFLVYRMPVGTTDSSLVANLGATTTTFDDPGGEPGRTYTYCVVAFSNSGGRSAPVCDDGTRAVVLAPSSVAATDGTFEGHVDITWESSSTSAVLFKIYRGSVFIRSVGADRRAYSDDGVASGVATTYAVTAVTSLGVESARSTDNGFRKIAVPSAVKASDGDFEDRVAVTWTDQSQIEDGYFVYRRLAGTTDPLQRIATRPSNASGYDDKTGVPGQAYDYSVTAFQVFGPGKSDTTESDPAADTGSRTLAVPTSVEASDGAFENQIALSWVDNSRYEESYEVWRRDLTTNDSSRVAVLPPNSDRYVDLSITFGVHYEYSVLAVDSLDGVRLGSSPAGKDQGHTTLLPPLGVSASESYDNRVQVAWIDQSSLETGYRISRDGVVIGNEPPNATSFSDPTATFGTQYTYCVQSVSGANASDPVCDAGQTTAPTGDTNPFHFTTTPGIIFNSAFDNFGYSVGGQSRWLSVGAPFRNYFGGAPNPNVVDRGAVMIFDTQFLAFNTVGSSLDLEADSFTAKYLGQQVATSGDWTLATYKLGSADMVAFAHRVDGVGWQADQRVTVSTTGAGPSEVAVDIDGNYAVVGTPNAGAAFWEAGWTPSTTVPGVARSVAISGTTALLGGNGSVRVCTRATLGGWTVVQTLQPTAPDAGFGFAVDLHDGWAVVGSHADGVAGRAYVFERDAGGTWTLNATLDPERNAPDCAFGQSVSIRDERILVGAPRDNTTRGAVYLYTRSGSSWTRQEVLGGPQGCFRCIQTPSLRGWAVRVLDQYLAAGDPSGSNDNVQSYVETAPYPFPAPVESPGAVSATDNTYRDKVQITWLDRSTTESGFRVYRDGDLIATVDPNTRIYTDVDAAPGRTYEYCVTAIIDSAARPSGAVSNESVRGCDFGRRPPDGNITGRVATFAGAGVSGANVCLDPAPNRSILFDGSGGNIAVADGGVFGATFTTEFWYRGHAGAAGTLMAYSTAATVDVFAVKNPGNLAISLNGSAAPTGVAIDDGGWHHIAIDWTSASGALHVYKDGLPAYSGIGAAGVTLEGGGALAFGATLAGAMDDIRVWDHVRTQAQIQEFMPEFLAGNESGLVAYWPLNDSQGSGAEELRGNRYGRISGGATWINEAPPMSACAVTDNQGNYVLAKLRYGTSTTFKVIPTIAGHQFTPAFKTITLSTGSPVQNEVGFTDITSFAASGLVSYSNTSCLAANVEIYVDGVLRGSTDGSGHFSVPVPPGDHTLEARQAGHTFSPPIIHLAGVTGDLANLNFLDTTVRHLSGLVAGGCNIPIGTLTLAIESEDRCFSRTITTAAQYDEALPPLKFFVRVTGIVGAPGGPDQADVIRFFDKLGAREVDLSTANYTLDFKYRAPLEVEVSGLPVADPSCPLGVPVIDQMQRFPMTINVFEDYGTLGRCPVDTGTVTVFDEIIDQEKNPVTLVVKNGVAKLQTDNGLKPYETAANTPNIFAGRIDSQGHDRSYQKSLTVVAEAEGEDPVTHIDWVIVTGQRPRTATFTAEADGVPLLILHDPPGDHSFSFVEQESTFCSKISGISQQGSSASVEGKVHFGIEALLGFIYMTPTHVDVTLAGGVTLGFKAKEGNELEICAKTNQEFRTSSDDLFIGRDGDVYMGLAMNLLFAKTDVVRVQGCRVVTSVEIAMGLDKVRSVYNYTDWHIRNTIIPQLSELARLAPSDSAEFNSARTNWQAHLDLNDSLKRVAPLEKNRSFSAGAEYSYSSTVDESKSTNWSFEAFTKAEISEGMEFKIAGNGVETKWSSKFDFSLEREGASTATSSRTTGYTLSDNDIGDVFSVDVKKDVLYGTPIFDLVAGTSSCPWEPWPDPRTGAPRSQPVDGAKLTVEPPVRNSVPIGSPAVFTLNMTNDSQAEGTREYLILPIQESNPGGAVIKIDGQTVPSGLSFFLNAGETRQATMTVERGPNRYFYDDLQIAMVPPCEYELFRNGGPLHLADTVKVSVAFDAPCSDITLLRPEPGWSVAAGTDSLALILTDFQLAISEKDSLVSVGAEYQLAGTDHWLPIGPEIPAASVPLSLSGIPQSVSIKWPMAGIPEGTYAVRAFTRCSGGKGVSGPATGVIDRTPPVVFGTPQPADGTLSFGEDISITYNENIDCASANGTNVTLEALSPTQALDVHATCNGRTLVLTPSTDLSAFEGRTLRATVTGIKDLVGNPSGTRSWTFIVRQGDLAWADASVSQDVGFGSGGRVAMDLINGLNQPVTYALSTLPAWLAADTPPTYTVPAKSRVSVSFQIAAATALGAYDTTVTATATTNPPTTPHSATLNVHVNVLRVPPTWTLDPAGYEHSMTVRARVFVGVGADSSVSPDDILAAFVGNEVRGIAHPLHVSDGWRYFLTVYGRPPAFERIHFQVWDSRTSKTYTATNQTPKFIADSTYGSFAGPLDIFTRTPSPANEQIIPVNAGWTWFSVNRRPSTQDDRTVAAVLSNLVPAAGDLVKAQDGSISMFDATAGWIGTLDTIAVTKSYRMKTTTAGEIRYESTRVLPSGYPIPVKKGWNWIGYTPDDARVVTTALGGLSSATADVLRSQTAFAEFSPSAWAGSLAQMQPGLGYELYRSNPAAGQFTYTDTSPAGPLVAAATPAGGGTAATGASPETPASATGLPGFELDYHAYQYDMVVTAQLTGLSLGPQYQVAALVDGEVRGIAVPVHVAALDRTLLFMMVRSNATRGETVHFQALDRTSGKVYEVQGSVTFEADAVLGSSAHPLALASDGVVIENLSLPVAFDLGASQPNPLLGNGTATLRYALPTAVHVSLELFDVNGRRVRRIVNATQPPGWYDVSIQPRELRGGIYFYRMRAGSFSATRRMVIVR